jgi:hypothetical protein
MRLTAEDKVKELIEETKKDIIRKEDEHRKIQRAVAGQDHLARLDKQTLTAEKKENTKLKQELKAIQH